MCLPVYYLYVLQVSSSTPSSNEPADIPVTTPAAEILTIPDPPFDEELENHTSKFQEFRIPDQWSEGTMECIAKQVVTPAVRKEIVQTLATILCARQQRPSNDMCREAAERLVLKYPFMVDPFGKRYVSYMCVF